jgi:hypothetical protein
MRVRGGPSHLQNLDFSKVFLAKGEVDPQRGQNFPEYRQKPAWRLKREFGGYPRIPVAQEGGDSTCTAYQERM